MPKAVEGPARATRVFVSYARADHAVVEGIYSRLAESGNYQVLLDQTDILPSEEWKGRLDKLIRDADAVVFTVSARSLASEVCGWEVGRALELNKRVVPVVIEADLRQPIPDDIGRLNFLYATDTEAVDASVAALRDVLDTDIAWLREHTRLDELAERWRQASDLGAQPLRGRELEDAERWLS